MAAPLGGGAAAAAAAADPNPNPFPEVVRVDPVKFSIEVKLNREISKTIALVNVATTPVAFKVKTTSRDRYGVRPTQGYIAPGATRTCEVILAQMKEYPAADIRDKFLVQSVGVQNEAEDIAKLWREKEKEHVPKLNQFAFHEQKIKCKLHVPAKVRAELASQKGAVDAAAAGTTGATAAAGSPVNAGGPAGAADVTTAAAAGAAGDEFAVVGRGRSGAHAATTTDASGRPNTATGNVSGIGGPPVSARDSASAVLPPAAAAAPQPSAAVLAQAGPGAAMTAQGVVVQAPPGIGVALAPAASGSRHSAVHGTASDAVGGGSATGKSAAAPAAEPEPEPVRRKAGASSGAAPSEPVPLDTTGAAAVSGSSTGGGGVGGVDQRKTKDEYRELLNQHVKLTLDAERTKREHAALADAFAKLQKQHELVQKTLQDYKHLSGTTGAEGSSAAGDADALRRRTAGGVAPGAVADPKKADDAAAAAAVAAAVAANAQAQGASGFPLYVVLAIALLCFVLGRILS